MLTDKIKKLWAVSTVSLVAATAFVNADVYNQGFVGQGPDCCNTYQGCPEIHPRNEGCGNWFGEVDVLYWRASGCGLGYGVATAFSSPEISASTSAGIEASRILNPKFRWDVGVRAGLGFAFDCGWDVGVYWTHFNTTAHGSAHVDTFTTSSALLTPLYGTDIGIGSPLLSTALSPSDIRAKWRYRLNLVDLELGREFCIGGCVSMRPFVGVRGAWTEQKYNIFVSGPVLNGDGVPVAGFRNFQDLSLKSEFEGGGLRGGFDTEWHMGCGFSLYGTAAVSVLYGRGKSSIEEDNAFFTTSTTPTLDSAEFSRQRDHWQGCRAITDLALGIRYRQFFCCDSVALTLSAGWENHMFFNDNRFENFAHTSGTPILGTVGTTERDIQHTKGDICFEGWTFAAKVEF